MAKKVIFDTDPGVDDSMALLLAHRHPALDLLGVTTGFGNADIATVTHNALYLKALFGIDAPVARGAGQALALSLPHAPVAVHGMNGMGDTVLPEIALSTVDPRPAHQFITDTVRAHPGEVTLICVGRMTNLALALMHVPDLPALVDEVVIMGGAFGTGEAGGNVSPVAEANIWGDPHAADRVFAAPWKVTAVGLDVTRKTILRPADFARLRAAGGAEGAFLDDVHRHYLAFHGRFGLDGCYVHDSSAVVCAIAPELFAFTTGKIRVATEGVALGQTILRRSDLPYPPGAWDALPDQRAATGVDADAVCKLILDTLAP
jgi:inosine-uridine nucleoside N-ribohydrolase